MQSRKVLLRHALCSLALARAQAYLCGIANENETDSGGDPCNYYGQHPHHCGCCDTPSFYSSDCCECQQAPVTGNATWWASVLNAWPHKATALRLIDKSIRSEIPADVAERWPGLERIDLSGNELVGVLPAQLGSLPQLRYLSLANNKLGGSLPPELGRLALLGYLSLRSNRLSGGLPPELGNLTALQELGLSYNQLTGGLPPELGNLTALRGLHLSGNQLSGGLLPELGNLASLQELFLSGNQLSGGLPPELGNLTALWGLDLSHNQLSGGLPPELGNLTALRYLYLSDNHFSGSLPSEFGRLTALVALHLQRNQLDGSIPRELGNLTALNFLYLTHNRFSGGLPPELGRLTALQYLTLTHNQLSGGLPLGFAGLQRLLWFDASQNPGLCGDAAVLETLTSLVQLELAGCCFQHVHLPGLPPNVLLLDVSGNNLSRVPRRWYEQGQALRLLHIHNNNISQWDTSGVAPLSWPVSWGTACLNSPSGAQPGWQSLDYLDVSSNPLNMAVSDFLGTLSGLGQLRFLHARDANLTGSLPSSTYGGSSTCSIFPRLAALDLSGNAISAMRFVPAQALVQADLSRNALTALDPTWWQGGTSGLGTLATLDARGNPELHLPVPLDPSSDCPELGVNQPIANPRGWSGTADGWAECTTLCHMEPTRFQVDTSLNTSVMCRCTQGRGVGLDCGSCPDDTYSVLSFESGRYSRTCLECPAGSTLAGGLGMCFADCSCPAGYYMAQTSNGSAQDVGATPCTGLAPEGKCLSCGIFETSLQGSRKASDCFCNSNRSDGGWEGLLQRQGQCGCPEGFHMNFKERRCVPCQAQEDCVDWMRSLEPPSVKRGFWALPAAPRGSDGLFGNFSGHFIWRCLSTAACPGNSTCGRDLSGTACSLCRRGFFRNPSGGCAPCSRPPGETRLLLVAILLGCVVFPISAHLQLRADMGEPRGLALAFHSVRTSLKQILKFVQILGLISLFGVEWPPVADSVFTGARAFSLDFPSWLGVACLDTQQQESMALAMVFRWMLPLAGVLLTCCAALLVTISGHVLGSARCCKQREESIRRRLRFKPLDVLRVLVFFLHLFFPSLLKNALLPLTCAPSPNGLLTLNSYPHVVCFEGGSNFWVVASVGMAQTVLLSLGFPLLLLFAWKQIDSSRTQEIQKQRKRWWAFIFVDFRSQKMFWVLVATSKDILLNLFVVVLPGLGTAQLLVTAVVTAVYACATFCTSPYPDASNTVLETCTASAVAVLCIFTASVGFQSQSDMPSQEASIAGGHGSSGYDQRTIGLVLLQGLSLVCPAAIVGFQLLAAFPRSRHCLPERLRPLSEEQRKEWSQEFSRAMRVEGGPLPRALAELDKVDFAAFRRAAISGQLAWRGLTLRGHSRGDAALHEEIAALSTENAELQTQITRLEAAREEERAQARKTIEHLKQQVDPDHRKEEKLALKEANAQDLENEMLALLTEMEQQRSQAQLALYPSPSVDIH